jgi:Fur family peroxide stress response transcriptional regulator
MGRQTAMDSTDEEKRMDDFSMRCRDAGVKVTHQRMEVFREILRSQDHPTVDQIFERVRRRLPGISKDTVYRTLWMLREMSLIGTVGYPYRSVHFDGNERKHDHFLCTCCGGIVDLESSAQLKAPAGIDELGRVESTHVEYRGLCRECLATKTGENRLR